MSVERIKVCVCVDSCSSQCHIRACTCECCLNMKDASKAMSACIAAGVGFVKLSCQSTPGCSNSIRVAELTMSPRLLGKARLRRPISSALYLMELEGTWSPALEAGAILWYLHLCTYTRHTRTHTNARICKQQPCTVNCEFSTAKVGASLSSVAASNCMTQTCITCKHIRCTHDK